MQTQKVSGQVPGCRGGNHFKTGRSGKAGGQFQRLGGTGGRADFKQIGKRRHGRILDDGLGRVEMHKLPVGIGGAGANVGQVGTGAQTAGLHGGVV